MKAPRLPSLFKTGRYSEPRRFEYKPRFYDKRKEELEKRRKDIEREVAREKRLSETHKEEFRERITETWSRRRIRRQQANSNIRLVVILAALALLAYYLYFNA